jgi:hypothetical protein
MCRHLKLVFELGEEASETWKAGSGQAGNTVNSSRPSNQLDKNQVSQHPETFFFQEENKICFCQKSPLVTSVNLITFSGIAKSHEPENSLS